jgi:hypothetical protein
MLTLVLKNNNLTFDGNHYLQINGTAIGTKMACQHFYGGLRRTKQEEVF